MISVEEALKIVDQNIFDFGTEMVPLSEAFHRILKEDWYADRPLPPYDRVTMDGIAISYSAFQKGLKQFKIESIAAAGSPQKKLLDPSNCLEVMTGSILPINVDTVIRYEDVEIIDSTASLTVDTLREKQNVHFKGEDRKQGDLLVSKNRKICAAEIGVAASIGKTDVLVARNPKVMVISTGDELVEVNKQPLAHQVRRSNVYTVLSKLKSIGINADSDHLNDDQEVIKLKLKTYLEQYDVLLLSGGVSKGKYDFLPEVLKSLQVQKLFHRVKQRPGKPFWLGKYKEQCMVFAFPGNPISSFMCMNRYFLPWLEKSLTGKCPVKRYAVLGGDVNFKPDLDFFVEVSLAYSDTGQCIAHPKRGNGSGDLANLAEADAFLALPSGKNVFVVGEAYELFIYR